MSVKQTFENFKDILFSSSLYCIILPKLSASINAIAQLQNKQSRDNDHENRPHFTIDRVRGMKRNRQLSGSKNPIPITAKTGQGRNRAMGIDGRRRVAQNQSAIEFRNENVIFTGRRCSLYYPTAVLDFARRDISIFRASDLSRPISQPSVKANI